MADKIVHITLPEETHTMLKLEAVKQGKTLAQMIEEMIKFYCQQGARA
ncbi:hypothetical protein JCM14036_02700 [Desulfotomaculum defluvii]